MSLQDLKQRIEEARAQRAGLGVKLAELRQERALLMNDLAMVDVKLANLGIVAADMDTGLANMMVLYASAPGASVKEGNLVDVIKSLTPEQAMVVRRVRDDHEIRPEQPLMVELCRGLLELGVLSYGRGMDTYVISKRFKEAVEHAE